MDCSTADMPTNVVKDRPASDVSSDDEPLINLKISASAKKPEKIDDTPPRANGTNNKKADLSTDESSDNEPLVKIARAAKKPSSLSPRKSVDAKNKASLDKDDSSDDEPLSKLAKKLDSKRQRKVSVTPKATPVTKSKRNAARKTVKYAESSSDSSDDEPLAVMKRKLTKAPKAQKNGKNTKPKLKDKSLKDSSSSDDDVPLSNLIAKKKPVKKNTKKTAGSQVSVSRKRREPSDESSEDEPLINLVKKNRTNKQTKNKRKASSPKKRGTAPQKPRKKLVSGSESNSSEDEPLTHQAAKHPQVTKILRIILERCDGEETGATQSLNQTTTDKPIAEKDLSKESKASEESSSEE
ncbi:nucleolar protein dao-5-like [Acanthopagrus latus]|uniref:nucleolar protein dao-5-like n=1 Tax=Acanthopagrus latus TaxID=8177 RepID=UPI00187BD810|nr:nucleolar protein dao-5-like [Acanthopagrus latus]